MRDAVFLDRDGVLNDHQGYVNQPADLRLLPGVPRALRLLREAGFSLYVISNQSGVGRGYFTKRDLDAITEKLHQELAVEGAYLDDVYYCLHPPLEGCLCRKPEPGLFYQAALDHDLCLPASYFIGDMPTDIRAGRSAGVTTVLVHTGTEENWQAGLKESPDITAENLNSASRWIIAGVPSSISLVGK